MARIGVYGGTFNPPHTGHLRLAREFYRSLGLEKVLIVPACIPPHKDAGELVSSADRANLCRLVFTDDFFEISMIELARGGKSYTCDTLAQLKEQHPEDELFLIMGSDMLVSFHNWYKAHRILELCTVCAASRGDVHAQALRAYVQARFPGFEDRFVISGLEPLVISSTELRARIACGEAGLDYLTQEEYAYIRERGIYT